MKNGFIRKTGFFLLMTVFLFSAVFVRAEGEDAVIGECFALLAACDANGHCATETDFGDFMADAICYAADTQIGFLPSGDLGNHLQKGEIRLSDLEFCLMNDSALYKTELTASELVKVLENSMTDYTLADDMTIDWNRSETDHFLQISGLTVTYDLCAPSGERIIELFDVNGQTVDPSDDTTVYTLVSTGEVLKENQNSIKKSSFIPAGTEIQAAVSYIEAKQGARKPENGNRITLLGVRPAILSNGRFIGAIVALIGFLIFGMTLRFKKKPMN